MNCYALVDADGGSSVALFFHIRPFVSEYRVNSLVGSSAKTLS